MGSIVGRVQEEIRKRKAAPTFYHRGKKAKVGKRQNFIMSKLKEYSLEREETVKRQGGDRPVLSL